ncbi:DNA-binding CsgD family transcriptional regulator/tetratricopeptide (TPR) repeat protein [Inquilinus ginsengisoli]|uniref:DNA-binding CsgD family transcriptional regulator/tetratricopeptide (TPR) repeat protein n=1 Tax=Inquilinus ginsengisoli TaxID=363840 RepID=A0ABU1JGD2_9PROT|nr:AAA family ATPase [Inquilinus ginsengisoli]MDR6287680.1 DNA-binding CsgD family transcriptional regulator/tetratricopeptide (TPR) repeat protein [Inquilinus ginsengisoli]
MELLERGYELQLLAAALKEACAHAGRIALVNGEAGIGKTSLVDRFIATSGQAMRILKGHCDALFTPSPLGPLHDIARQTGGRLLAQLQDEAPRTAVFSTVLDLLDEPSRPTLLVIEDIHWADEATLDLIRFLSRRIAQTKVLLILTYRDDEVGARHPLRVLLGDLATSGATLRIEPPRLTIDAVRSLIAGRPFDPEALYRQTRGNPFFITEILSWAERGLPKTVRDAVLARAAKLTPAGRYVLEAAAVIGSRMDHIAVERVLGGAAEGLAECIRAGLLEATQGGISFRHELVREAVLTDLEPGRRRELHRSALDGLRTSGAGRIDLAQLAQFAEGAGDGDAVLEFGPAAARAAVAAGAHRAAAAQYLRVLGFAGDRPPAERAQLLEAYAEECAIIDDLAEASRARQEAIELWRQAGDRLKEGENLAALAWPLVRSGRNAAAEEASRRAIEVLEALPPTRQLAAAYRIQAHLRMLHRDREPAVRWGRKAIALATRLGDEATIAAAENVVGSAMLAFGDERGRPHLDRSLALARRAGLDSLVGLAHSNLGSCYGEQYQFAEAERHLADGIAYTAERDLDHANHYMRSWLALTRFYQGRWDEAGDIAVSLVERPHVGAVSRIMALIALGRVRTRRGDPGAAAVLDEALEQVLQTDTLQRLAPARAARAEAAWLAGEPDRAMAEATAVYDLAIRHRHPWHAGEFSFWRWRAGDTIAAPGWAAPPFVLQIRGDWHRAAEAWHRLGCPYEQARALADGDQPAQLAALEIFDRLGAAPAAAMLRQRMRGEGVRRIPRGPRASTRRNPLGLTRREVEILGCLAEGLSNGRIGDRLHVSSKTVDHHVSSVLAKLGAATRGEAVRIAHEQNLMAKNGEGPTAKWGSPPDVRERRGA